MEPVCVIGAGPAGLAAGASLRARSIPFRILDAGRRPGGIWDIDRPGSPMYESAHFISSKTLSGFPDYPMPEAFPDYPRHEQVLAYLEAYAGHHGLEERTTFGALVTSVRRSGGAWEVTWRPAPDALGPQAAPGSARFSAVVIASGANWLPNEPDIPGRFDGSAYHSVRYRGPEELEGRRVLVVGGGNSGVDIACDAARSASRAFLSLRRGYHFIPKYVLGRPADVFAHAGPPLPAWLEQRFFAFLLDKILVGDLTRFGLPEPDHPILASHPIMNTEVLHHLGHGDLEVRPDVARFEGENVVFADGSRERVDVVVLATGYRRLFEFLEAPRGEGSGAARDDAATKGHVAPDDLFLNLIHRRDPALFFAGLFESDGGAYGLLGLQGEAIAGTIALLSTGGAGAERLAATVRDRRPDLRAGRRYVDSLRHEYYVNDRAYRRALRRFGRRLDGWASASGGRAAAS